MESAQMDRYGVTLSKFMQKFTLGTDWAATIPNIVRERSSSARVPLGWKWVLCIFHKLNNAFKNLIESEKAASTRVYQELEKFKEIFPIFKAAG